MSISYYTKKAYSVSYNAIFKKYSKAVQKFIKRPFLAWGLLVIAAVLLMFFMKNLPSGLVPQEDQGVFLAEIRAPEGYTLQQTQELTKQVEEKVKEIPELESYAVSCGYGLASGNGSNFATLVVRLKHWDDRPGMNHLIDLVIGRFYYACKDIKNVQVLPFQLPQVPGYGTSNSVSLIVEDPTDGDLSEFAKKTQNFLTKLSERPEISMAMSSYSERYPKYRVDVDATQCDRAGVSPKAVLSTLGSYCGGSYVGNFNQFGKIYRIMASAVPEGRLDPSSLQNIFIKVKGGKMAPISEFVTLKEIVGPSNIEHFNLFQSITCNIVAANGFSEGEAHEAIAEVFKQEMPSTATYEYSNMSREETTGSNTTALIYIICVVLIYLILASLYNSWFTPLAVLLSEASLKAARMAYLPSLYFSPQGQISRFSDVTTKTYSLPLQLSMDVDVFGSITNKKRAAEAVLLQAQMGEDAVRTNLISAVAQQYYMLQLLDRQLEILTLTDSLWNASLETQKALWENGKAYSTAVNQMESSYLNVKTQIVDTINPAKLLLNAVGQLTQPIFARGKLKTNLKINQLTQEDLQKKYVQTVIDAGNQVNEAMADCQAAREKYAYYHRQVQVLYDAYAGTHELMDNGKASYIEVLTAQENLLSSQLNEAANMYKGAQAVIALYITLGGGTK